MTIAVGTDDAELRELIDAERFDLAASHAAGRDAVAGRPGASEPIAPMHVMAGTINRVRDLVIDGKPVVLGYVAVGDALICTNPLYGRGCSLGGVHARLLATALRDHGSDFEALALQMHDGRAAGDGAVVPGERRAGRGGAAGAAGRCVRRRSRASTRSSPKGCCR